MRGVFIKLFFLCLFFVSLNGRDLSYKTGWQMRGFGGYSSDIDVQSLLFNNTDIKYLWAYQDGQWKVSYIHDISVKQTIPAVTTIKNNEGFWIKTSKNGTLNINILDDENLSEELNVKNGWHMYGYNKAISPMTFDNNKNIEIVWLYDRDIQKWKAYSGDKAILNLLNLYGIPLIDKISQNEGFWIKAGENASVDLIGLNAPIIEDSFINLIQRDNLFADLLIGHITVKNNQNIDKITLIGDDSNCFHIDKNALTVSLKNPQDIDFKNRNFYKFQVQAENDSGKGNIANVTIYLTKKPIKHIVVNDARKYDFAGDILKSDGYNLFLGVNQADINGRSDAGKLYTFSDLLMENEVIKSIIDDYPSTQDYFSKSISVYGDYLAVGVPGKRHSPYNEAGEVDIYRFSTRSLTYKKHRTIVLDEAKTNANFGYKVALSKDFLLVSKKVPTEVYFYNNENGDFIFKKSIEHNQTTNFGSQIAVGENNYFAISEYSSNGGKVHIYKAQNNGYIYIQTLQESGTLGANISFSYPYLAISNFQGKVFIYKIINGLFKKISEIEPKNNLNRSVGFGTSGFDFKGNLLAIGASEERDPLLNVGGAVYLYNVDNNVTFIKKIANYAEGFGNGVAIAKNYIAIGANYEANYINDTYTSGTGGLYIYSLHDNKPMILNMQNRIYYHEASPRNKIFKFITNKPVSYHLSGNYVTMFRVNSLSNMLESIYDMEYDRVPFDVKHNNKFPITITIKDEYDNSNTYNFTVILTPILFHDLYYKSIKSPVTNRIWLDRNIGAKEVCDIQKYDMSQCFGYYFEWGRGFDGHQLLTSLTIDTKVDFNSSDKFVISNVDWLIFGLDNNGSKREEFLNKTDGSGVCPNGYRVPTIDEYKAEIGTTIKNANDLMQSFLKFPLSGIRRNTTGEFSISYQEGYVWTSNISSSGGSANTLHYGSDFINFYPIQNSHGVPIRCIKEYTDSNVTN